MVPYKTIKKQAEIMEGLKRIDHSIERLLAENEYLKAENFLLREQNGQQEIVVERLQAELEKVKGALQHVIDSDEAKLLLETSHD